MGVGWGVESCFSKSGDVATYISPVHATPFILAKNQQLSLNLHGLSLSAKKDGLMAQFTPCVGLNDEPAQRGKTASYNYLLLILKKQIRS